VNKNGVRKWVESEKVG